MAIKEPRKVKGYKATETNYGKAMNAAKKDKIPLASLIEVFIYNYGIGNKDMDMRSLVEVVKYKSKNDTKTC